MNIKKTSLPLVSVVITTYNRLDKLLLTIQSIINQTYSNIEIIVVDDGSTDATSKHIKNFSDSRIRYYKITHWGGPAKPRNFGIEKCNGEYICFCDDDDIWKSEKIEKSLRYLFENKALFLFTGISYIDERGHDIKKTISLLTKYILIKKNISKNSKLLLINNIIPLSSVIIHKNLLINEKFSENKDLITQEDHHLWIRLNKITKIIYLKDKLVYYRIHTNGISKNKHKKKLVFNKKLNILLKNKIIKKSDYVIMKIINIIKNVYHMNKI